MAPAAPESPVTPVAPTEGQLSAPDINIIPSTPLATSPNVVLQQEEEEKEEEKKVSNITIIFNLSVFNPTLLQKPGLKLVQPCNFGP